MRTFYEKLQASIYKIVLIIILIHLTIQSNLGNVQKRFEVCGDVFKYAIGLQQSSVEEKVDFAHAHAHSKAQQKFAIRVNDVYEIGISRV